MANDDARIHTLLLIIKDRCGVAACLPVSLVVAIDDARIHTLQLIIKDRCGVAACLPVSLVVAIDDARIHILQLIVLHHKYIIETGVSSTCSKLGFKDFNTRHDLEDVSCLLCYGSKQVYNNMCRDVGHVMY